MTSDELQVTRKTFGCRRTCDLSLVTCHSSLFSRSRKVRPRAASPGVQLLTHFPSSVFVYSLSQVFLKLVRLIQIVSRLAITGEVLQSGWRSLTVGLMPRR